MFFKRKNSIPVVKNDMDFITDEQLTRIFESNDEFAKIISNNLLHCILNERFYEGVVLDDTPENALKIYKNMNNLLSSNLCLMVHEFVFACQCIILFEIENSTYKKLDKQSLINSLFSNYSINLKRSYGMMAKDLNLKNIVNKYKLLSQIFEQELTVKEWFVLEESILDFFEQILNEAALDTISSDFKKYYIKLFYSSYFTYYIFAIEDIYSIGSEKHSKLNILSKIMQENSRPKLTVEAVFNDYNLIENYKGQDDLIESVFETMYSFEDKIMWIVGKSIQKISNYINIKTLKHKDVIYMLQAFSSYYISVLSRVYFEFIYDEDYWRILNMCMNAYVEKICIHNKITIDSKQEMEDNNIFFMFSRVSKKLYSKNIGEFENQAIVSLFINLSNYMGIENYEFLLEIHDSVHDVGTELIEFQLKYLREKLNYNVN